MLGWILALAVSAVWGWVLYQSYLGRSSLEQLPGRVPGAERLPLVSVIVAAKEEQENIQDTIRYLHHQSYPHLEIIAINDRSNDTTGARLDAMKAWSDGRPAGGPTLRVIHIANLPEGWLGKNHALYQGYLQARGSYLLFTDADVRFEPHTIRDSMAYVLQHQIDHLTLIPRLIARSFWLKSFVHFFMFCVFILFPPWAANDDLRRTGGLGIGAFNLMKREAYERIGTHRAFAMRPDDDLRLGMLVKQEGLRQRVVSGVGNIAVEWYTSLKQAIKGLEKNLYSGFQFRLSLALLAVAGLLLLFAAPLTAVIWSRGFTLVLWLLAAGLLITDYVLVIRSVVKEDGREAVVLPISVFVLLGVLVRSVWLAHRRRGVYWRGTFYPLAELKRKFRQ